MSNTGASKTGPRTPEGTKARPRIGWPTKIAYGFGSIATTVKNRGLTAFLLIYYNQVIGLDAIVVSGILMVALVVDAIADPLVGQASDNFRSRWGRRHPFMYLSALPFPLLFFAIWNPPALSHEMLAAYLLICVIGLRFIDTFFELPAQALGPELVSDYDGRTTLLAIRQFLGVVGAVGLTLAAYNYFMRENPDGTGGLLARDGYFAYSVAGAAIIAISILVCAVGTHHCIPLLRQPPARSLSFKVMVREIAETLRNRAFLFMVIAMTASAIAAGTAGGLELYWSLYFFELSQLQISQIATAGIVAALVGIPLSPLVGRVLGKKRAGLILFALGLASWVGPITLRLLGILPPNGHPAVFIALMIAAINVAGFGGMMAVLLQSMMADVVEDSAVRTGRRSEGLLFSANTMFNKMVSGVGVFMAGAILTLAAFPKNAERGEVPEHTLMMLGLMYVPFVVGLNILSIIAFSLFPITRKVHEENLRTLASSDAAQN